MTHFTQRRTVGGVVMLLGLVLSPGLGQAQVVPDATLQAESSIVTVTEGDRASTHTITGGAVRGDNLFHSFEHFSVPAGDTAAFANADAIDHIISRVTGGDVSNLAGEIQSNGSANLFLINPAGVIIGPDARLNIGGSFLASTGEGLRFGNGFVYDTTAAEVPPLLTVRGPIGLVVGNAPGDIQVVGESGSSSDNFSVPDEQTLALIGGKVSLDGGTLNAAGGRIELGGVREASELSLDFNPFGFDVGFDGVNRSSNHFGNIQLSNQSVLDTSGRGGGAIELQGGAIALTDGSALISDTLGDRDGAGITVVGDRLSLLDGSFIGAATQGSGAGSGINISSNEIDIVGTSIANYKVVEFNIFLGTRQIADRRIGGIVATTVAAGRTGNITLNTQQLLLDDGVLISTESFGTGDSGDVDITATESLDLRESGILAGSRVSGVLLITPEAAATGLSTSGIPAGGGGNIKVNTARLAVENGSSIGGGTLSDRDSGTVLINATESLVMRGPFSPFVFPTSITTVSIGGTGAAGDLQINTGHLSVEDGSIIFADSGVRTLVGSIEFGGRAGDVTINATESVNILGGTPLVALFGASAVRSRTFSDVPAGRIQITTPTLRIRDGGRITSETLSEGAGGAIDIEAQTVLISGAGNDDPDAISGIFANSGVETRVNFTTGDIETVSASGTGGSVTINTDNLTVQDAAEITVGSFDSGAAGNLNIFADAVRLDGDGALTATTTSDGGGNINLTSDTLALDQSRITASSESGNGGNISFTLRELLSLRNRSLVSTEAGTAGAGGDGGDITLNLPDGFIVAVPTENSDIRANAFEGNGGNVSVTARSLLGIEFRPNVLDTPFSDITASSRFGSSGTVTINELDPNIFQDDAVLPTETAPPPLASGCRGQGPQTDSFVSIGRGGLPTNPTDMLSDDDIWQDLAPIPQINFDPSINPDARNLVSSPFSAVSSPLIEAQSWTRTEDGRVRLLAGTTETSSYIGSGVDCGMG